MDTKKNNYKGCTKFENWLKKSGGYPTMDYEITHPIDFSLGVGAKHKEGGVTIRGDKYDKTITLKISSWIGVSAGARHIYGKLVIPSLTLLQDDGSKGSRSGYGTPDYIGGWSIDITKELNQHAFDLDDAGHPADKCFEDMYLGEETIRFERDEEEMLINRATYIFIKWFTGDWKFKVENDS